MLLILYIYIFILNIIDYYLYNIYVSFQLSNESALYDNMQSVYNLT